MKTWRDYVQPTSMTWWAGVLMMATGSALMAGLNHPAFGQLAQLLNLMAGNAGAVVPAQMFLLGMGFVGFRAKLERM